MAQITKKGDRNLLEILVAVAWLDGVIQPTEKAMLTKIATEQQLMDAPLEELLQTQPASSSEHCYQLLQAYLGKNPQVEDYQNLLSTVSNLIYSDDDIATEEAALLTQMQNLDPQHTAHRSTFNKAIAKIQKMYRVGVSRV